MSVDSSERVIACCSQLHNHKGPYYDKWLKNYSAWVNSRSTITCASEKMNSRWTAGMRVFIRDEELKRDHS